MTDRRTPPQHPPVTAAAGSPYAAPAAPSRRGALPYGLGFLAYIPIPGMNFVVAGIVMAAVYPSQRRHGALAAENSRRAANWGLTLIAVLVACIALSVVLFPLFDDTEYPQVAAVPVLAILPLGIAHLVIIIVGLVKANRGEVFVNKLAIPFIRARP